MIGITLFGVYIYSSQMNFAGWCLAPFCSSFCASLKPKKKSSQQIQLIYYREALINDKYLDNREYGKLKHKHCKDPDDFVIIQQGLLTLV